MDDPLAHLLEPGLDVSRHQRYALERELGHGSMGVVYAARDRLLERPVAVKVMAASLVQDPELRRYFEREARAAARLSHRNVVVVHDFGYDPKGAPFVVMERLRGFDLRQALSGGQAPPLERRLAVVLQVLAGLAHAHAADVVHRDVKPANVFLTEEGVVKLLDFGLARLARAGSGGNGSGGQVMGTADYMSPEQVRGADDLDRRSDLFSCGSLLFELLTGRPPFHAESFVTIAYRVVHEEPDYALVPPAAAALIPVLQRALAKTPADRFDSALDFATEIGLATGVGVAPDTIQAGPGWNVPLPFPKPPQVGTTVRLRKTWQEGPTRPLDPAALPAWPLHAPEEDHEHDAHEPAPPPRRPRPRRSGRVATAAAFALALAAAGAAWLWLRPTPSAPAAPVPAHVAPPATAAQPAPSPGIAGTLEGTAPVQPSGLGGSEAPLIPPASLPPAAPASSPTPPRAEERYTANGQASWSLPAPAPPTPAAVASPAPAAPPEARVKVGRWVGFITDETCREKGAVSDHGSCLQVCLRRGRRPMIAIDGGLYWLKGLDHISGTHDRRVMVEGRLDLDRRLLTVASGGPAH